MGGACAMAIDPSRFHKSNVTDTCAIWNVLSSRRLFRAACTAGCSFCCTAYVLYECLHKPRKVLTDSDRELRSRLVTAQSEKTIISYDLSIADLQDVAILESRRRLSKGELTSIAFAAKTRQAFLTDDQKARKLALSAMEVGHVQTTPHLFGWLMFHSHLGDGDKDDVVSEHEALDRPLRIFFEAMYLTALQYRLLLAQSRANE